MKTLFTFVFELGEKLSQILDECQFSEVFLGREGVLFTGLIIDLNTKPKHPIIVRTLNPNGDVKRICTPGETRKAGGCLQA